jgi:filamentous hemagglutinin family protein
VHQTFSSLVQILICIFSSLSVTATLAQVIPDNTLDTQVGANGNVSEITGGQTRGGNLFHSFQDFSVETGTEAFFNNANNISNIFSRVTGGSISTIDGLIRANGSADLFLINPNGIIFGEGAQLDIGGSFLGSTASSIVFAEGEFSATDLDSPPLLTINAPIGLGLADNPGEIVNRSTVQDSEANSVGLEVLAGNNLSLVGGQIEFEGGNATASGGNVELAGLSTAGTIGISEDGSLTLSEDVARADISLSNSAEVDVTGAGGGKIIVNARNLDLTASSFFNAGITADSTSSDPQAGDIVINVTDNLTLDESRITNQVNQDGVGNSGNININTGSLETTNGGIIDTSTFGQGNAGLVEITASDTISIDGENANGSSSLIGSRVEPGAVGNAAGVNISTTNLTVSNGGYIDGSTFGQGNAGLIEITANDITFEGETSNGFPSSAFSQVNPGGVGNAAGVKIKTDNLTVSNGGLISANTFGQGNGGDIQITASDSILMNTGSIDGDRLNASNSRNGVLAQVRQGAVGNAGDVIIKTDNLNLANGATIGTGTVAQGNAGAINITANDITFWGVNLRGEPSSVGSRVEQEGVGNAGDVNINTGNFTLTNGGQINAGIVGQGEGGDINITATGDLNVISGRFNSGIFSVVNQEAVGKAGNVNISTGNLTVTNGGLIDASTSGQGNAGLIDIIASDTISIDGERSDGSSSRISSRVEPEAIGNAEGVTINTDNLTVTNGAYIDASTFGQGNAGLIDITASDITFEGETSNAYPSSAFSQVNPGGEGDAGGVTIETDNLTLKDGGLVSANTFGQGDAGDVTIASDNNLTLNGGQIVANTSGRGQPGNITIEANSVDLVNQALINAETQSETGESGIINLQVAEDLTLQDNSLISAQALENANGGNLTIDARFIIAVPNSNSDIIASAEQGQGGNITIDTKSLFGIEERPLSSLTNDINASSEFGLSGTVDINILEVDPSQDSLEIPVEPVQAEVNQTCEINSTGNQSEFVVTGRGGLPPEPEDNFRLPTLATDENTPESQSFVQQSPAVPPPIIEATGWVRNAKGNIVLVASPSQASSLNSHSNPGNCNS